jgi:hypothetical protein
MALTTKKKSLMHCTLGDRLDDRKWPSMDLLSGPADVRCWGTS